MPRVSYRIEMAEWRGVSALQIEKRFHNRGARPVRLQQVPLSVFGHQRNDFPRLALADLEMVSRHLSDDRIQKRNFRKSDQPDNQSLLQNRVVSLPPHTRRDARSQCRSFARDS